MLQLVDYYEGGKKRMDVEIVSTGDNWVKFAFPSNLSIDNDVYIDTHLSDVFDQNIKHIVVELVVKPRSRNVDLSHRDVINVFLEEKS